MRLVNVFKSVITLNYMYILLTHKTKYSIMIKKIVFGCEIMSKALKVFLSIIFCVILVTGCADNSLSDNKDSIGSKDVENIKVAFTGDSICMGYEQFYDFGDITIFNNGAGGYTTEDVLADFKDIPTDYDKLFIICGVNDCGFNSWKNKTFEDSMNNFEEMFKIAKEKMPDTKVYVTGVFPTLKGQSHLVNTAIKYNEKLKALTEKYDNVTFVSECWNELLDSKTGLGNADYYKNDGLHPKKEGYAVLSKILKSYIIDK